MAKVFAKEVAEARRLGNTIIETVMDYDEFIQHCAKHGHKPDPQILANFARSKTHRGSLGVVIFIRRRFKLVFPALRARHPVIVAKNRVFDSVFAYKSTIGLKIRALLQPVVRVLARPIYVGLSSIRGFGVGSAPARSRPDAERARLGCVHLPTITKKSILAVTNIVAAAPSCAS
jgi:hypothetical protein